MKTKKIIFLTGLLMLVSNTIMPQTYYYNETKTFYEDGYIYQCDKHDWEQVTLYNKENKFTYAHYNTYKDGSRIPDEILRNSPKLIEYDDWTRKACGVIADKFFSPEERSRVKGKEYQVVMIIDSSTGRVIEVYFRFMYNRPFATIPVSTYRKIELELKEKIWFTPTDEGRKRKNLIRGWRQEVSPYQLIIED